MHSFYSWHECEINNLLARKQQKKLPHALLLYGMEGLGKLNFALAFSELLLCDANSDVACGKCRGCKLIQAGNHPDINLVQPEAKDKAIKVDQIREVINSLGQTSQQGGYQAVIINLADNMNIAAANALLKTLEEPVSEKVIIILISTNIALLPATIRSRCQQIAFRAPDFKIAKQWLQTNLQEQSLLNLDLDTILALSENAPLKALEFVKNNLWSEREQLLNDLLNLREQKISVIKFADKYAAYDLNFLLMNIVLLVHDLIKVINKSEKNLILNVNMFAKLREISAKLSATTIFKYLDELLEYNKHIKIGINLNKQLFVEKIALAWRDLC